MKDENLVEMLASRCRICDAETSATTVSEHLASEHGVFLAHALLTPEITDANVAWIRKCMIEVEGFSFISKSEHSADGSRASVDDDNSSTASEAERKPGQKGRKAVYKDTVFLVNNQKFVRCLVCHTQLHWTQRRVHIYTKHLDVPDLFHCPYCPYASTSSRCPVDNHVRRRHHPKGCAVVRLAEFEPQIIAWLAKCFRLDSAAFVPPIVPPAKKARSSASGYSSPGVAATAASSRAPGVVRLPAKAHPSSSPPPPPPSTMTKTTTATPPQRTVKAKVIAPKDTGPRVVCRICKMKVLTNGISRHVLQDHLKLPHLYKCPECDFGSSTYETVVIEHAKFKHNVDHIISFADQYAQQIKTMTTFCFPP